MPKVYLSPAYHYWNPCAVAGCDETTHNNLYLDVLEPYLAACGIQYKRLFGTGCAIGLPCL